MAPRKKKSKQRKTLPSSPPPSPPPSPPVVSSPRASPSSPRASPSPTSEHGFLIQYSEGDLSWNFNCKDPDALAINEVKEALAQTLDKVCHTLNTSREELSVYTSFPTSIGERLFTIREWLSLGRQPYVTICSNPNTGLLRQRNEARERLQKAIEEKEKLITDELSSLVMSRNSEDNKASNNECEGCNVLRNRVSNLEGDKAHLELSNANLQLRTSNLEESLSDLQAETVQQRTEMNKVVASLINEVNVLKRRTGQILRRIIIQDARKKVVKHFGGHASAIGSYHDYFTAREADTLALGVSGDLLDLLKDGTWGLNKAAHLAPKVDKAYAVMELDGSSRKVFKEAFQFAYEESVDVYWEKED